MAEHSTTLFSHCNDCLRTIVFLLQIVAYNKVDVPDSGDYWELVRDYLTEEEGLTADQVFPISAATGRGVRELVRGVRQMLVELGPAEITLETEALNLTKVPKRINKEVRRGEGRGSGCTGRGIYVSAGVQMTQLHYRSPDRKVVCETDEWV